MRKLLFAGAAFGCLMMGPQMAKADSPIYTFSGSGLAGGTLASPGEGWEYSVSLPSTSDVGWGSPGVTAGGSQTYGEAIPATDFEITFNSAIIDASQLNLSSDCGPGTPGIVFCSSSDGGLHNFQWAPTLIGTNGIVFDAPAGVQLSTGNAYVVNIFLEPGAGVNGGSFTGNWSTGVPEPVSLSVLGVGLFALGWLRRRRM
jgi:hypothetical protein